VGGLRQRFHKPSWLKTLMPMNHVFVTVLPQTFPGASGQMDVKMLLQPNSFISLLKMHFKIKRLLDISMFIFYI